MKDIFSEAAQSFLGCLIVGISLIAIIIGIVVAGFGHPIYGIIISLVGLFVLFVGVAFIRRTRRK